MAGHLNIDCAGVEYSPYADADFFACLDFYWNSYDGRLELSYGRADGTNEEWGSVSGFLPPAAADGSTLLTMTAKAGRQ